MKTYYIYIITNLVNTVLYVGVTNNLERRLYEHKHKFTPGFSSKYNLYKLVYCEETSDVHAALAREKEIKGWRREKKDKLIATINPLWNNLAEGDPFRATLYRDDIKFLASRTVKGYL